MLPLSARLIKMLVFIRLLFCLLPAHSQSVPLLTLGELNNRMRNGTDTTYIINFWATWCVPCRKELPSFEKMNSAFKNEKLKVLLVSVDFKSRRQTAVLPFVKREKLKSAVFLLNEKNEQEWINRIDSSWSGALPATLFVKGERRHFFEQEFTFPQLVAEYKNMQL